MRTAGRLGYDSDMSRAVEVGERFRNCSGMFFCVFGGAGRLLAVWT